MKYYKLTDENGKTRGDTQWGEGVTHKATGKGKKMCTGDVIHVYDHPLKAVMFNPGHADFRNPKLWECHAKKVVANDQLKIGVKSCTTVKEIPLPEITTAQRVKFALYCALEVYRDEVFVQWANYWLNGKDRTESAASAARSAESAAWSAARSAAWSAESAAWLAASAAESAARSARSAARAAARSARSAESADWSAARAAARSAAEAAESAATIDFVKLIKKAMDS